MTDNFEKKVAVDGPVVNAGELGSSTFSAMSLSLLKFVGQASLVDDAMLPS